MRRLVHGMKRATAVLIALLAISASINGILLLHEGVTDAGRDGDDAYKSFHHAMFRGTAVEIKGGPGGGETVTFSIVKTIKQHAFAADLDLYNRDTIDVVSSDRRPGCFFDFEAGVTYVVYSRLVNGTLVTDACWGTHPYSKGGSILLDPAVHPVPWP